MPFPSPLLSPPTLTPWQMSFNGLNFGGIDQTATYQLQSLTGIDGADVEGGDAQRPLDQGEFIGLDVLKGRDIVVTQVIKAATAAGLDVARRALGGAVAYGANVEIPLYIQLPSGLFACMARPRRHNFTADVSMVFAKGGVATTQFHATDPRWYAAPTKTASVGLPSPLGGMTFPATFPVSFGGGGVGGVLQITNAGLFEMRPIFVITGPCINPVITNLTLPGAPTIGFNITLAAGDTLVIDTDFQSVVYTASGTTAGTSRRLSLRSTSVWFNLPPGLNQIQFSSSDGTLVAATLAVRSADAWASL